VPGATGNAGRGEGRGVARAGCGDLLTLTASIHCSLAGDVTAAEISTKGTHRKRELNKQTNIKETNKMTYRRRR
jgi:hypothetical protein